MTPTFEPTTAAVSGWRRPSGQRRSLLLAVVATVFALFAAGCAENAAGVQEIFPLLPAAFGDAPPPGIKVLLDEERTRLLGRAPVESDEPGATLAIDDSLNPPSVTALDAEADVAGVTGDLTPTVTVVNPSVNIRSGPGLSFSVVGGAQQGTAFQAIGLSADELWWRICCIRAAGDPQGEATERAWISSVVVTANEAALAQPVLGALFPEDLNAVWDVTYACGSSRCEVVQCTAQITAEVRNAEDPRWLEIERKVAWADGCGDDSIWLHQIDRIDGSERYANVSDLFLFNFWAGVEPGVANSLYTLDEDQQVVTWCSEEQKLDLEEGEGWSARYNGMTCHDVRTGMLVSMKYTKRWLFTGEYEGEVYESAYFGDFEVYEVRLADTNVELDLVRQ